MFIKLSLVFVLLGVVLNIVGLAQPNKLGIDSLESVVQRIVSDTEKINLYLSFKSDCNDTIYSLAYFRQALKLANKIHSPTLIIKVYKKLGEVSSGCLTNDTNAIKYYRKCIEESQQNNLSSSEEYGYVAIAQIYMNINNYAAALQYYNLALSLKPAKDEEITIIGNIGLIYKSMGAYPKALQFYTLAIKELDQVISTDKSPQKAVFFEMAGLLMIIAEIEVEMGNYDESIKKYNQALEIERKYKSGGLKLEILLGMGNIYERMDSLTKAELNYIAALELGRKIKFINEEPIIFNNLAGVYLKKSN